MFKNLTIVAVAFLFASNLFGALPPGEWDRMRRSGYSSEAIDKYITLDKSASAGITHSGQSLQLDEEQLNKMHETNLVSQIKIIGDGKWFNVTWKDCVNPPKKVTIIDPSRLFLSEADYKKTKYGKCYYRIPDSSIPVASSVPLFAVPKMRLAELAYHPKFQKELFNRIKQLGIDEDPRVGRISTIETMKSGKVKSFCKWGMKGFTPKPFTTLTIFDRGLNFVRAVLIESKNELGGDFQLADLYGTVLSPQKGDFVLPLPVARELCLSQGKLLFQKAEKPLKIANIFGTPTFSTDMPAISHSFPEMLFPGLYRFGVTRGDKDKLPCTQFAEIMIQPDITAMVDFFELKEAPPQKKRGKQPEPRTKDSPINLIIKRLSIRYFREQ